MQVRAFVDDDGLKFGKRLIDGIPENGVGGERDLRVAGYLYAFAIVDVDALAVLDLDELEGA